MGTNIKTRMSTNMIPDIEKRARLTKCKTLSVVRVSKDELDFQSLKAHFVEKVTNASDYLVTKIYTESFLSVANSTIVFINQYR